MRRTTAVIFLALVNGLALTGCAAGSNQSASSNASATPSESASSSATSQPYELGQTFTTTTSYGAEITVEIPAEGPAEVEQLSQELGIGPVRYARVSIDNSEGTEDVYVNAVSIYDEDGKTHEFTDLAVDHFSGWLPDRTDSPNGVEGDYGYTLNNGTFLDKTVGESLVHRAGELYDKYLGYGWAPQLQVNDGWLVSTEAELPERITQISVQPHGMDEELLMTPGGTMPPANSEPSRAPVTTAPTT